MSDEQIPSPQTKEAVAFHLAMRISTAEKLHADKEFRQKLLALYRECLDAVRNEVDPF